MSKICPRCKKLAKKDADGFTCITCGWTEYVIPPLKKLTGHIPYADSFYLPYRGANPKHRGVSGAVITLLWQTKKKLDRVFYFMDCPINGCNDRTIGRRSHQYAMRKREEHFYKFVCMGRHLWYLVVLNGEPLHWLSNDLEVDMPKVGKKHFSYTAKGRTAAKKYAKKTGKKMTNKKKY